MKSKGLVKHFACQVCVGKSTRNGKCCAACGKQLPPAKAIPNKHLPKGQHKAKRKARVNPAAPGNPHEFRRAH